jgi:hypothetical protein
MPRNGHRTATMGDTTKSSNATRRDFLKASAVGMTYAGLAPAKGAAPPITLVREVPGGARADLTGAWLPVLTHTHRWRWPGDRASVPFDEAQRRLVEWCAQNGVRALGVGSPWNPVELASYVRYENEDRDLYYSGKVDPRTVMDTEAVNGTVDELNKLSGGRTLFYLDNENPKQTNCHVWWFGYRYDYPAWHDYSQDRPIRLFLSDKDAEINSLTGQPHTRRTLFEIQAAQHGYGAVGVFAHPTRWWLSGSKFITNVAAFAPLFVAVYGKIDGITVMGDRPFHPEYQRLWYNFLDTGAVAPGFAETDYALNAGPRLNGRSPYLNYMPVGPDLKLEKIAAAARAGQAFASNGPLVTMEVDGHPMGSVVATSEGRKHRIEITAYPAQDEEMLGRVEVVARGGRVIAAKEQFRGGKLTYELAGANEAGYVVARVFGANDAPEKDVRYHAITNPAYLHPSGFHYGAAETACRIRVQAQSPWIGGSLEFQDPAGKTIRRLSVKAGEIRESVPADARVVLRKGGERDLRFFIALENEVVQKRLRYVIQGDFRRDYPNIQPSQVPVEAFGLAEMREALQTFSYSI